MFLNFTCRNELCYMMFTCAFNQVFHGLLFRFIICFFFLDFFVQVILQILYGCCERLFNLYMNMHFARPPCRYKIYLLSSARGAVFLLFDPGHHHNEVETW